MRRMSMGFKNAPSIGQRNMNHDVLEPVLREHRETLPPSVAAIPLPITLSTFIWVTFSQPLKAYMNT